MFYAQVVKQPREFGALQCCANEKTSMGGRVMKGAVLIAAACGLLVSNFASAAEIKVLSSGAVKEIYEELAPQFEKSSGHKLVATWSGTALIRKQVGTGEPFDLVIVGAEEIDNFIAAGKVAKGSRVDLVKSAVGVAVKAGSPKPDISSGEALKKAMLAAKSIAYSTGPSGAHIQRLFENFGIANEVKSKAVETKPGTRVGQYLARGEAELGFQQVSELMHEQGITFLGPLPQDIQNITVFSSGIPTGAKQAEGAKALQAFLTSSAAAPAIKKNGMEPNS
jgi:molybdate transport system substrate-binding protein